MPGQKLNKVAKLVWEKEFGKSQKGTDAFGTVIAKAAYRDEQSEFGWDIDHIIPKSKGGTDNVPNLRPLAIENNRRKADD